MFCGGRPRTLDSEDLHEDRSPSVTPANDSHDDRSPSVTPAKESRNKSEDMYKRRQSRVQSVFGLDIEEIRRMRELRRHSDNIDHRIKKLHKQEKKIQKLLLLGTGESGKSTFAKQMKIIHIKEGYTTEERQKMVSQIRNNIRDAIVSLCEAMKSLDIALDDLSHQDMVQYMCNQASNSEFVFPQVFYDYVSTLWHDKDVQKKYKYGEIQLLDSAKYLFEHLDTIRQPDYVPSDQDILRARQMTTNIHRVEFTVREGNKPVDFQDRQKMVPQIRNSVRDAVVSLCEAMKSLDIKLNDHSRQDMVRYIWTQASNSEFKFPQVFYDYVSTLWQDKGIQQCYKRSSEFQLLDSAKYLFEHLDTIRQPNYVPSDQDILRARQMTTNIHRVEFTVREGHKPVDFQLYDVGGQKGERRKWIQVFQDVNAIVFLVDISCYDVTMMEDNKNKLIESIEVFEQVWNNKYLRNTSVLLFLNKIDILDEKISQNRKFESFVDSLRPGDPYEDFIKTWNTTWPGPQDKDVEEFISSYPGNDLQLPKRRFSGRDKRPSVLQVMDSAGLQQETIRTAVFIKQLFQHIISNPLPVAGIPRSDRGSQWHRKHCLRTYYTCAVDTETVKKVFESVKTFMLFKTVTEW